MTRSFLFFLMCLLFSLQAFAGVRMGNDISEVASNKLVTIEATWKTDVSLAYDDVQQISQGDDEDGTDPISAGDDTMPVSALVCVSHALALAPPLCNDPARQPPFLPPPARPPRA